jgi:hypothetical protein
MTGTYMSASYLCLRELRVVVSIPTICSLLSLYPECSHYTTCPGIVNATCISGDLSLVGIRSIIKDY